MNDLVIFFFLFFLEIMKYFTFLFKCYINLSLLILSLVKEFILGLTTIIYLFITQSEDE